ncbi:unnamed protein product [Discula destructiva]
MSTATLTRPPRAYTAQTHRKPTYESRGDGSLARSHKRWRAAKKEPPPLVQKVGLAAQVFGIQGVTGTMLWLKGWREYFYPPAAERGPNIVKAYEERPDMAVRIFFPSSYDLTSPETLPTVLTIHGGGFCIGTARDDDEWNRAFADAQSMLVISLPYSKAPRSPFPGALYDLEALYLGVLGDESLPIDRTAKTTGKVAILGFDAGGNLALSLSQLPKVKQHPTAPTAVVSISGYLDLERPVAKKLSNRPYKPTLPFPRSANADPLAAAHEAYVWSYVPYGHDLRDPLLSPAFASCDDVVGGLPAHVCLVGAELDALAHESWRMACRLVRDGGVKRGDGTKGRWRVPDPDETDLLQRICGSGAVGGKSAETETSRVDRHGGIVEGKDGLDETKRFGFEEQWQDGAGSVKWILVQDVLHGFDRASLSRAPGEEAVMPAYVNDVGTWLRSTVWKT